jgi:hypothetical protein
MTRTEAEWAIWAREHRAAFQTEPLVEAVRGERVQVGFSLTFYVAAPLESAPGAQRTDAVAKLWDELKLLAKDALPEGQLTALVQLEQSARVVLRSEKEVKPDLGLVSRGNELKPEVGLTFHVFPRGASLSAVTDEHREKMKRFEKRLLALGVKRARA